MAIAYQAEKISMDEAMHLFQVMKKYDVRCDLDAYLGENSTIGIRSALVNTCYCKYSDRSDVIGVKLDHTEFLFESDHHFFEKHIGDRQIIINISHKVNSSRFDFQSEFISDEGIEEARFHDSAFHGALEKHTTKDEPGDEVLSNIIAAQLGDFFNYYHLTMDEALYVVDEMKRTIEGLKEKERKGSV